LLALNIMAPHTPPQPVPVARVWLTLMALAAACSRGGNVPAPTEPEAAIRGFMNAVRANSIIAMGEYWGTSRGPAVRIMDRTEMEQRLTVIRTYLTHDSFEFTERNVPAPAGGGQRILDVRIVRGNCRPVVPFTVVRSGSGWLVQAIDLSAAGNPARPCPPDSTPAG
jgi:hypothetical protein